MGTDKGRCHASLHSLVSSSIKNVSLSADLTGIFGITEPAIFGVNLGFADVAPLIFVLAPGAFLVLGYLMVLFNKLAKK